MITQSLVNLKQEMLNQIVNEPNRDYQMGNLNPDNSSYGFVGDQRSMGILNRCDKQMAENIKWIKNVLYPDEKIIVWAHSEHTMYERNKVKKTYPPDFPFHLRFTYGYNYKNTGSYIKDYFGNTVYNLGFSTTNGTIDYSTTEAVQYLSEIQPEKGSIEEKLSNLDYKYPFIDFIEKRENLPQSIFNEDMISNFLDGTETNGNLSHFFDGILFIRDAKPIKYLIKND